MARTIVVSIAALVDQFLLRFRLVVGEVAPIDVDDGEQHGASDPGAAAVASRFSAPFSSTALVPRVLPSVGDHHVDAVQCLRETVTGDEIAVEVDDFAAGAPPCRVRTRTE